MNREELAEQMGAVVVDGDDAAACLGVVWPIIQRLQEDDERLRARIDELASAYDGLREAYDAERARAERAEQALRTIANDNGYFTRQAIIALARSVLAENPEGGRT